MDSTTYFAPFYPLDAYNFYSFYKICNIKFPENNVIGIVKNLLCNYCFTMFFVNSTIQIVVVNIITWTIELCQIDKMKAPAQSAQELV